MKKRALMCLIFLVATMSACGGEGQKSADDTFLRLRRQYLEMTECSGHMDITADYGQRVYTYGVDFSWQKEGETLLTLTAPENVAGTTAHISVGETALEYDGVMMETGPLDSRGLSPIDVLPAFFNYMREGYGAECVLEGEESPRQLHIVFRDPEKEPGQGIECELWLQEETGALLRGEMSEDGITVIQCEVSGFTTSLSPRQQN